MTRATKILFVVLAIAICFQIGAVAVGMTFEHFAGQDGDQ